MPAIRISQIFFYKRPEPAIFFNQKANKTANILVKKTRKGQFPGQTAKLLLTHKSVPEK
jgi:hypothetical protein